MLNKIQFFIGMLFLVASTGCFQEEIEVDLKSDEVKLVVNAWITTLDEDQEVVLSSTSPYLGATSFEDIDDAIVVLSYEDNRIELVYAGSGTYALPAGWRAEEGQNYTLEVNYQGDQYLSTSTVPRFPEISDLRLDCNSEGDTISDCLLRCELTDTPGEGDGYYIIAYRKQNSQFRDTIQSGDWISDEFLEGFSLTYEEEFEEELFSGDTLVMEAHSIGLKAVQYLDRIDSEVYREGLFDPPPVNVPTNISNGAVGYFTTANSRKYEIVVP